MEILLENKAQRDFKQKEEEFNKEKGLINSVKIQLHLEQAAIDRKKKDLSEREASQEKIALELVRMIGAQRYGVDITLKHRRMDQVKLTGKQVKKELQEAIQKEGDEGLSCKKLATLFPEVNSASRFKYLSKLKSEGVIRQEGVTAKTVYFYVQQ